MVCYTSIKSTVIMDYQCKLLKFRLKIIFVCLCPVFIIFFAACSSGEPALPPEAIERIRMTQGYVLAPTYLPKGFEFVPLSDSPLHITETTPFSSGMYVYQKHVSKDATAEIVMSYPSYTGKYSSLEERLGLEAPADGISEIDINGLTAYLFHGNWSTDTLRQIARAELPINPEWDYDGTISIRFAIDVPDNDRVWVDLRTVLPTDEVTDKDLVSIARSVVVVE
jgi:hypothetical protein